MFRRLAFPWEKINLNRRVNYSAARVLVTAGGTLVPLDDVRHIGNFSTGRFGAALAEQLLELGAEVHYLHGYQAAQPFWQQATLDLETLAGEGSLQFEIEMQRLARLHQNFQRHRDRLHLYSFRSYDDYYKAVRSLLQELNIDYAFLAAAVSDFGTEQVAGKIASRGHADGLDIHLVPLAKVLKHVREWSRNRNIFQVSFKLLSGISEPELLDTAYRSLLDARSHLVFANDLAQLRALGGKRAGWVVTPENGRIPLVGDSNVVARALVDFAARRVNTTHFSTEARDGYTPGIFDRIRADFEPHCRRLALLGFMPQFSPGTLAEHGSFAVRDDFKKQAFWITARGSAKRALRSEDLIYVLDVDFKYYRIHSEGLGRNRKGSLNTPLVAAIFQKFPNIHAVLHTHTHLAEVPSSTFPQTPGTDEYVAAGMQALAAGEGGVFQMAQHGSFAVGDSADDAVARLVKQILREHRATQTVEDQACYRQFADYYDLLYSHYQHNLDAFVRIVMDHLDEDARRILDLASGTGQMALQMARRGFWVEAADLNASMLAVLRRKARGSGYDIPTYVSPMEALNLSRVYDSITLRQAANYLPSQAARIQAFTQIRRHLARGGAFVFNSFQHEAGQDYSERFYPVDSETHTGYVWEHNRVDASGQLIHDQDAVLAPLSGSAAPIYLHDQNRFQPASREEWIEALTLAGFNFIEVLNAQGQSASTTDRSLYFVARSIFNAD